MLNVNPSFNNEVTLNNLAKESYQKLRCRVKERKRQ